MIRKRRAGEAPLLRWTDDSAGGGDLGSVAAQGRFHVVFCPSLAAARDRRALSSNSGEPAGNKIRGFCASRARFVALIYGGHALAIA